MGHGTVHPPLFGHGIPESVKGRWRLVRELLERQEQVPMPDAGGRTREVNEVEREPGHKLPPSLREWEACRHDTNAGGFAFPDIAFVLGDPTGHPAYYLTEPDERPLLWGVRWADLSLDDPSVCCYSLVEDGDGPDGLHWEAAGADPVAESPALLALEHGTLRYALGPITLGSPEAASRRLAELFAIRASFGQSRYHEGDGLLLIINDGRGLFWTGDLPADLRAMLELSGVAERP